LGAYCPCQKSLLYQGFSNFLVSLTNVNKLLQLFLKVGLV